MKKLLVNCRLEAGDVVLTTGKRLRDRFTQLFTGNKWNHVALATGDGTFIEADRRGTFERNSLECDNFKVMRHTSVSRRNRIRIVGIARSYIGMKYSVFSNIEIGIRLLLNKRKHRSMIVSDKTGVNCCQLVALAFTISGYDVHPDYIPRAIIPEDFITSPFFRRIRFGE